LSIYVIPVAWLSAPIIRHSAFGKQSVEPAPLDSNRLLIADGRLPVLRQADCRVLIADG
jgi:hypothetical protein